MARVVLISFAGYPYTPSSLMPDNGLASLAGCLREEGHDVRVLDYGTVRTLARLFPPGLKRTVRPLAEQLFVEGADLSLTQKARFLYAGWRLARHQRQETLRIAAEAAREAEDFGADVVGLKLWNGDGFSGSVAIAEAVRERIPRVPIVAGGPQVDYFQRHILDYTNAFDMLLCGEGEIVLPRLVRALTAEQRWQDLPGLVWREGEKMRSTRAEGICALDELPMPDYSAEVYPALAGDQKIRIGVVDESRGCPNRCAFCIHPQKSGGQWNVKSPRRVTAEMRRLMQQLDTRYFIYSGSNTSAEVALGIARQIVEEGLQVRYGCFGHVQGIARADFELLRRSGCEAIFYGLESGSQRLLKRAFNKNVNLERAELVFGQTQQAGIRAITSVIFPAPFEDERSREETMDLLRRVRPDSVPVTIPGMIPGTPWEREAEKYGFEKARRKDMWEYALTYKIKLLYPPSFWKPLPYRLNGKSSKQLFRECEQFIRDIEAEGMVTNVPHEMALMAEAMGQGGDLKGFRDLCRAAFLSGDAEEVSRIVAVINEHMTSGRPSGTVVPALA